MNTQQPAEMLVPTEVEPSTTVSIPPKVALPAEMLVPTEVEPLAGYRMWVRFSDGVEGEADFVS